jgi:ribonucleotide monophosphatase NagD (HAD superfamily)
LVTSGLQVVFVTNSSGSSRVKMAEKLSKLLELDIGVDKCLPTCYTAACYMKKNHPDTEKVYVIGGQGIGELESWSYHPSSISVVGAVGREGRNEATSVTSPRR